MSQSSPILGAYKEGMFPYESDSYDLEAEVVGAAEEKVDENPPIQYRAASRSSSFFTSPSPSPLLPAAAAKKRALENYDEKPRAIRLRPRLVALEVYEEPPVSFPEDDQETVPEEDSQATVADSQ